MNDQINNGEGFLKEKLGGYQVDPPASVWKTISTRMGGRRRKGMVIVVLAAAASVALAVTLGINYFGQDLPQDREMAEIRDQPQRTTAEPVPQAEVNEGIADQGSRRTPEREDLEEKVVRTFEAVTTETDEPAVFETIPSTDVAEDTHADQTVQAAEIEETKLALTEELAEGISFHPQSFEAWQVE